MSEALWAQVISGAFGLATMVVSTYLPARIRRRNLQARQDPTGCDSSAGDRDGDGGGAGEQDDIGSDGPRSGRSAQRDPDRRASG